MHIAAASLSEGAAAEESEAWKHRENDPKFSELGWVCISHSRWRLMGIRVERSNPPAMASLLAITTSSHKCKVLAEIYSRLNFTLVQAVARALLARCAPSLGLYLDIFLHISLIIYSNSCMYSDFMFFFFFFPEIFYFILFFN